MRGAPAIVAALLVMVLMAGCIERISSSRLYSDEYVRQIERVPISDPDLVKNCLESDCVCMVCKKGTAFFGFLTSYVGGYCYFDKECKPDRFQSIATGSYGSDLTLNYFRLGQGPSFSDFGDANGQCVNRLGMAVQWLVGGATMPYALPASSRAVCLLDKGVLPVYVLYSKGENIDVQQTYRIAHTLGTGGQDVLSGRFTSKPVGPVVITTEINYDAKQAGLIKEQIKAINSGCGNDRAANKIYCQVALAPKLGDKAAVEAVLSDKAIADQVDLIAYGIDANLLDLHEYCYAPSVAWDNATDFSRYALYEKGKPSIIPYVLFDALGSDASGTCAWDESSFIEGYSAFFSSYAQALPAVGVIGVAPYSFSSTGFGFNNPLSCKDCSFGKNENRLRAWYAGCQAYTEQSRITSGGSVDISPMPGTIIRFPSQPSGSCNDNNDLAYMLNKMTYTDKDFLSPQMPELEEGTETLIRCDACISEKTGPAPFSFGPVPSMPLPSACEALPELDQYAGQFSIDPMFMRAVVATESSFNPCAAARVCKSGYYQSGPDQRPCFNVRDSSGNDQCYLKGFNSITDPTGTCQPKFSSDSGTQQRWRWCGLGLMQSLEPPYDYWPAEYREDGKDGPNVAIYKDALRRGLAIRLDLAKACNPTSFNPFNASDSACVGGLKLAEKMRDAAGMVARFHNDGGINLLDWDASDADKDQVFIAYVAANLYVGTWNNDWVNDYALSWTTDSSYCSTNPGDPGCAGSGPAYCYGYNGYSDFVEYVRNCIPDANDRGAQKMAAYYSLRERCTNSFCPSWKRLDKAAKWSVVNGGKHPVPYAE